ncbi:hypothetical protein Sjap_004474 [Stephania japonica]|uniref:DAGKc domain-containing protein n=1 Tax=Stephania japonica TaxID=461633 RepID=A0AAP0K2A9_9MAGN
MDGEAAAMSSNLFLDHVGEVVLSIDSDGLSWKSLDPINNDLNGSSCLGIKLSSKPETEIKIANVYAAEVIDWGLIHESSLPDAGGCLLGRDSEMHRFTVHGYQRSKKQPSLWLLVSYTFGQKDLQTCQNWVEQINALISKDAERPKRLLVFVHPLSGKRNGCKVWEDLAPIFSRAKVETKGLMLSHALTLGGMGCLTVILYSLEILWKLGHGIVKVRVRINILGIATAWLRPFELLNMIIHLNVTVTKRAGHALDAMTSITDQELYSYDGVVVVGGDGFFSEILNGLLCSRHKAPYPPAPENIHSVDIPVSDHSETELTTAHQDEDQDPLLQNSEAGTSGFLNFRSGDGSCKADQDCVFAFPNKRFRLGIIPAGSTDAIVICSLHNSLVYSEEKYERADDKLTSSRLSDDQEMVFREPIHFPQITTGTRDAITSALHIVLGKRVCLDIAQVVRWKMTASSKVEPLVRYAASFVGYGFYGDVISESEQYRWMGPKRYDYAGTKVFLKHRSYEAEINYIEVKTKAAETAPQESFRNNRLHKLWNPPKKPKTICRVNCSVCNEFGSSAHMLTNAANQAIISCRNERAPDGLVADAHLADGFLHLILIKDCPLALYLWHLTQLARKDGDPLDFKFVEHYKTPAFTFTSSGEESVWNLDGELFQAHQLSAQVFRGLISLFAAGPETNCILTDTSPVRCPIFLHKSVDTNWVLKLTSLHDLIQFYIILQMVLWAFEAEKMNTEENES